VKSKDILIEIDDDAASICLKDGEKPLVRTMKNYMRVSRVMALALQAIRDDLEELQGLTRGRRGRDSE
jgi:hypothetical protein